MGDEALRAKKKRDYIKGKKVERLLERLYGEMGLKTFTPSDFEDWYFHLDLTIKNEVDEYRRMDVKSYKEIGDGINEGVCTWVELKATDGRIGWLYAEDNDYIAFEDIKDFQIVDRAKLAEYVNDKIKETDKRLAEEDELDSVRPQYFHDKDSLGAYMRYCRKMRHDIDVTVKIYFTDLDKFTINRVMKNEEDWIDLNKRK